MEDHMEQRAQLQALLKNDLPDYSGTRIVIWGAGNTTLLAQQGLRRFALRHPWFSVYAYCDGASEKWGTQFCGRPVISPMELQAEVQNTKTNVIVSAQRPNAIHEIRSRLAEMGIRSRLLDEVVLKTEADSVLRCYDLLDDEESKNVYYAVIRARVLGLERPEGCQMNELQYFSHSKLSGSRPPEVFVDCGAYIGDTLEVFLDFEQGCIGKYIAFEADLINYRALLEQVRVQKSKWNLTDEQVITFNCAVGEEEGIVRYKHHQGTNGAGSVIARLSDAEEESCPIVSLDGFLKEPYSFLKADIESYEYSMLRGAEHGIRQYHPFCAICIYHNAVDLYSILLLLHEYVPEYHFSVKHHSVLLEDTVLYCW